MLNTRQTKKKLCTLNTNTLYMHIHGNEQIEAVIQNQRMQYMSYTKSAESGKYCTKIKNSKNMKPTNTIK